MTSANPHDGHNRPSGQQPPGDGDPGTGPVGYAAARLRLLQQDEPTGAPRRAALAQLTDDWLGRVFDAAADGARRISLVAVGGYGRGELSPRSDLDVLLLHDGPAARDVAALADRLWYPVWDLGLALDHSVRTPAQARRTAASDLKVHLGLLDARHVAGDQDLTTRLRTAALADWREQAPKRLPELQELCAERAARHGELAHLLEPDIKEARGGLRDATALRAVAASWLADAPRDGLADARGRLLDVRDALHLVTGRATDRLSLQDQDQLAATLGLPDADALLRKVYEAARTLSYAGDVTWREVRRVLRARSVRGPLRAVLGGGRAQQRRTPLADGVVEHDGEAVLARTARPERDPVLPLRAAAAAAQAGLPLSPPSVRRLAGACGPLPVPWPAEAREQLVTLLGAGRPAVDVWEALEAEGLVTALLPEWEHVRCRPQRNPVHTWTVDRHLIETAVHACAMTRRVERPDLLLVACLLHDIGKGRPGDHSQAGETIARDVARRIGFDRADTEVVATLVRHHLLLVTTATRRDLEDPATVRAVADAVGSTGTLELLHALTEADALATGPAAWSSWRASLVDDLTRRVADALAGETPARHGPAAPTADQERLAVEAYRAGGPVLRLSTRTPPVPAAWEEAETRAAEPEPLGVELLIAVPDRPGVLPAAAGVLAMHRLAVRTAELRSVELPAALVSPTERGPGGAGEDTAPPKEPRTTAPRTTERRDAAAGHVAAGAAPSGAATHGPSGPRTVLLLTWRVAAEYGSLPQADRLRADLVRALEGSLNIAGRLAERDAAQPRRRGVATAPARVTVAAAASRLATVIEVRAHDAPGLLHRIGRALEDASVRVRSAHVATLGADAVDTVYVTAADGSVLADDQAASLAKALEETLR